MDAALLTSSDPDKRGEGDGTRHREVAFVAHDGHGVYSIQRAQAEAYLRQVGACLEGGLEGQDFGVRTALSA